MKLKIISALLLGSLSTVGIFGFFGLGFIAGGQHNCPFSFISGGNCYFFENSLALISHHAAGLQRLTQSIVNFDNSLLALSILFILIFSIIAKFLQNKLLPQAAFSGETQQSYLIPQKPFLYWFAVSHKKDPDVFQRALV